MGQLLADPAGLLRAARAHRRGHRDELPVPADPAFHQGTRPASGGRVPGRCAVAVGGDQGHPDRQRRGRGRHGRWRRRRLRSPHAAQHGRELDHAGRCVDRVHRHRPGRAARRVADHLRGAGGGDDHPDRRRAAGDDVPRTPPDRGHRLLVVEDLRRVPGHPGRSEPRADHRVESVPGARRIRSVRADRHRPGQPAGRHRVDLHPVQDPVLGDVVDPRRWRRTLAARVGGEGVPGLQDLRSSRWPGQPHPVPRWARSCQEATEPVRENPHHLHRPVHLAPARCAPSPIGRQEVHRARDPDGQSPVGEQSAGEGQGFVDVAFGSGQAVGVAAGR